MKTLALAEAPRALSCIGADNCSRNPLWAVGDAAFGLRAAVSCLDWLTGEQVDGRRQGHNHQIRARRNGGLEERKKRTNKDALKGHAAER